MLRRRKSIFVHSKFRYKTLKPLTLKPQTPKLNPKSESGARHGSARFAAPGSSSDEVVEAAIYKGAVSTEAL